MPNSYFITGVLLLNITTWAWFMVLVMPTQKGWRGFIERVGLAGFWSLFFGSTLGGGAVILNRPFRGSELLTVALVESVVCVISAVCMIISDSDDVDGTE